MKSVFLQVVFWMLASTIGAQSAKACIAPDFERYLLFKQMPESVKNVSFKARVRIENILRVQAETISPESEETAPVYPPTLRAELFILNSESHPALAGQFATMDYEFTSCGPHLAEGLSGYLVGSLTKNQNESATPQIQPAIAIGSLKYYPVFTR